MAHTIHAVHDDDLEKFLLGLNLLDKIKAGYVKCSICKEVITLNNIYTVYPDSGDIKVSCDKPQCIIGLKTKIEGGLYGKGN